MPNINKEKSETKLVLMIILIVSIIITSVALIAGLILGFQ